MIDPYLYPGTSVLKNKLGILEESRLETIEVDYVFMRLKELKVAPLQGNYDFTHLCDIHKYIFQDLYDWAGEPRIIDTIRHEEVLKGGSVYYAKHGDIEKKAIAVIDGMKSEPWEALSFEQQAEKFAKHFAALWGVHPFRDGNTRAVTHFCCQYAAKNEILIDKDMLADYSPYLRDCLVMANKGSLDSLRLLVFSAMKRIEDRKLYNKKQDEGESQHQQSQAPSIYSGTPYNVDKQNMGGESINNFSVFTPETPQDQNITATSPKQPPLGLLDRLRKNHDR